MTHVMYDWWTPRDLVQLLLCTVSLFKAKVALQLQARILPPSNMLVSLSTIILSMHYFVETPLSRDCPMQEMAEYIAVRKKSALSLRPFLLPRTSAF